jgi:hypothetical protein
MTNDLLDYLDKEDSVPAPEAFPVATDIPVEGPQQFEQPPIPTSSVPGPDVREAEDALVPPVPAEAPGNVGAPAPLPGTVPADGPTPEDKPKDSGLDVAKREGELGEQRAKVEADRAAKEADIARQHDEDERIAHADFLERRKVAEDRLDAKVKEFEEKGKLVDPRQHTDMTKARLSVIFGGLGAAFRSAGGGDAVNHRLVDLQRKWDDDVERQKANIATLKDGVLIARTGVKDVDEARQTLRQEANARLIAQYNSAIKQGEAQLKGVGVPQAQVDADKRIQALHAGRFAAQQKARKEQDEHDLTRARIDVLRSKARGGSGPSKAQQKADDQANKDVAAYESRTEGRTVNVRGKVQVVADIQALKRQLHDAIDSGDTGRMRAAAIAIQEKTGSILSGGKTTNFQGHIIESPKTLQDNITENLGKITGKPTAGKAYLQSLDDLLSTVERSHLEDVDHARDEDVARLLGKGGKGRTPGAKENAVNLIGSRYDHVVNPDGTPRYNNDPNQAPTKEHATQSPGANKDQDREAIEWAKKNLRDPRARKILKANGL